MADTFLFSLGVLLFLSFYLQTLLLPPAGFTQVLTPSSSAATGSSVYCIRIASELYHTRLTLAWARPCSSRLSDSPPFRPSSSGSRSSTLVAALLLLAGDVAVNPVPAAAARSAVLADQLTAQSTIGILNCRSAANKTALIHDLISDRQLDVLFLSETWFTDDTPQSVLLDVAPPEYAALHVVRPTGPGRPKRGGGLAAVFRQSVPVRAHHLASKIQPSTFELLSCSCCVSAPPRRQ